MRSHSRNLCWIALLAIGACQSTSPKTEELPALPNIAVQGNRSLSSGSLNDIARAELDTALGNVRSIAAADDAAFALEQHYRELGFPAARVTYVWSEPDAENPQGQARFTIVEGTRVSIEEFLFTGNRSLGSKALTALYTGPRLGLLGAGELAFEESRANSFTSKLADTYFDQGFLNVRVEKPELQWNVERTRATLIYRIEEGPRFKVVAIEASGLEDSHGLDLETLTKPFIEQRFVPRVLYEVRGKLRGALGEAGFATASVEGSYERKNETGDVHMDFVVKCGQRTRIRSIKIEGHERTRESTIRKLIALRVGDWYKLSLERETFDALYASGLFERVSLELADIASGEATLNVTLEESSTGEVFVEPGYGSYERGRIRAGIRDGNMFGLGHLGRAEVTAGFIAQQVELGYTNPAFYRADLELDFSTYWTRREEPSFLRTEAGAGTTLTRTIDEHNRLSLGYRFRHSQATQIEVVDPATLAAAETINVSSVTLTPTFDSRVGLFVPSSGSLGRFILEYASAALGSEIDFFRLRGQASTFLPLREGTVLAASARTGLIIPVGDTDEIPIQERFFNGGEVSVRSFKQDKLGRVDALGSPIGGEAFTTISVELRQRAIDALGVAAFADTGNVVGDATDYFEFDGFRHALGIGARYLLPIGPLRLDWGWNPNPRGREENWTLHLSVGMAF